MMKNELLLGTFKGSPLGIALEDLEGRPLFVNPALCSMLGFTEEEMRSKHCVEFSPTEDAQKDWALFEQLRAGTIDHYQVEKYFFRRDGSLVWGRLSISLVGSGTARIVLAVVEDLSHIKAAQDTLDQSTGRETLGSRLIEAQEQERRKIARELRDDIHQQLVLAVVTLDRLQRNLPETRDEIAQKISEAMNQLVNVSTDVHALSHRLHPARLDYLGLSGAASSLCRELSQREQVRIDFHFEGIPKELPSELSLCLYRVLEEGLRNAVEHSGSQHLEVSLRRESNEVQLTVRDWGIGFDSTAVVKGEGLGLSSMRERLRLVGGELSIESKPLRGTTIRASCPLSAGDDKSPFSVGLQQ